MDEFKKIANVIKKSDETAPHEVILVFDATSGQNVIYGYKMGILVLIIFVLPILWLQKKKHHIY